jgi:hypothetical protein
MDGWDINRKEANQAILWLVALLEWVVYYAIGRGKKQICPVLADYVKPSKEEGLSKCSNYAQWVVNGLSDFMFEWVASYPLLTTLFGN